MGLPNLALDKPGIQLRVHDHLGRLYAGYSNGMIYYLGQAVLVQQEHLQDKDKQVLRSKVSKRACRSVLVPFLIRNRSVTDHPTTAEPQPRIRLEPVFEYPQPQSQRPPWPGHL